jgi:PleD family two-component response regulator
LRTIERTRLVPIILVVREDEGALVVRALELGVNDYLMRPLEKLGAVCALANPDQTESAITIYCGRA